MAERPFGPWRPATGVELNDAAKRPLHGTIFDEFALLYEAGAAKNLSPRDVDECEFWELAAVLGANRPPDTGQQGVNAEADRRAWNAEQARRREAGLPQMEHAPSSTNQASMAELAAAIGDFGV